MPLKIKRLLDIFLNCGVLLLKLFFMIFTIKKGFKILKFLYNSKNEVFNTFLIQKVNYSNFIIFY